MAEGGTGGQKDAAPKHEKKNRHLVGDVHQRSSGRGMGWMDLGKEKERERERENEKEERKEKTRREEKRH